MRSPVLGRRIVPSLTLTARERDDVAHRLLRDLRDDPGPHRPPPLPNREPQLLLPRDRHDQLDRHRHVVPPPHPLPPPHHPPHPPPPPRPAPNLPPAPPPNRRG